MTDEEQAPPAAEPEVEYFGSMHGPVLPPEEPSPAAGPEASPEPPADEHAPPAAEPEETEEQEPPAPPSPYTEEEQAQMARAASIEHRMNLVVGLMLVLPLAAAIYFAISGGWVNLVRVALCLAIPAIVAPVCIRHVVGVPKQVAIRIWFGGRISYLHQEGYHLVVPYVWDLYVLDVTDKNTDLSQTNVPVKNGTIGVLASMTWHPDYKNPFSIMRYLDIGQVAGVEDIIDDPTNQGIRQHAIKKKLEPALRDKEGFRDAIINAVINVEDETLRSLISTAFKNGSKHLVPKLLGIEILQITVPDIALPEDIEKIRKRLVIEEIQKKSETTERDHNISSIKAYRDEGGLDANAAAEFHLISQKKIKKAVNEQKLTVSGMPANSDPFGLTVPLQALGSLMKGGGGGRDREDKTKDKGNDNEEQ